MNPAQPARPAQAQAAASSSPEKGRLGKVWPLPIKPWMGTAALAIVALELVGLVVVLAARGLMQLDGVQEFVARYPGHPSLPASAPIGVPAWLGWQHFFNAFLMVLIIRTGLTIRRETKPEAYWASARKAGKKVSLTIWFHQGLDLLWVLNGLVFFVLLFATGQWMRIVPTSWDVIPNALSAGLQYATLNWPTENGWVHYNALQMLAYFVTVFIAAPLAVVSGFRMSTVWPEGNKKLSQAYPIETARKIHFPVMLYFVAFIAVHVFLVFTTGALRNLNHMYAAQGSSDPAAYAADWTGFLLFLVSLAVIAAAWFAARPLVIAPIARLFGKVSSR
jgi:thiosulfate reductase cytochrome b subunit